MITLTLLLITLILGAIILLACGAGFIAVFGDVIVAVVVIGFIIKLLLEK